MTVRDFLEIIHNSDNLMIVRDAESESKQLEPVSDHFL